MKDYLKLIDDDTHRQERRAAIADALAAYRLDRESWERVLRA